MALLYWINANRRGQSASGDRLTETLRALELIGENESGQLALTDFGLEVLAE